MRQIPFLRGRPGRCVAAGALLFAVAAAGCGGDPSAQGSPSRGGNGGASRGGWGGPGGGPPEQVAAVPVEVAAVERASVASYIETNGALEAENEVDIVARTSGPIVTLEAEEGMLVEEGQLLARIDPVEARAQYEIAKVQLQEATRSFERGQESFEAQLISEEEYEQLLAARESTEAELRGREIVLGWTEIRAPFDAIVIERAVKLAENVTANQRLFRISDFDPLLCRIRVPEKELGRLSKGQRAWLRVEAWPDQRFPARVLRISPVVDPASGTILVTLEVEGQGRLRPGMFASVYLEVDRREEALVIPKRALSLESLGDTVYVMNGDVAARRAVELGYEEEDVVEVRAGLEESDRVIVVGQDGLSDGTPVRVLSGPGAENPAAPRVADEEARGGPPGGGGGPGGWQGGASAGGPGAGGPGAGGPGAGGPGAGGPGRGAWGDPSKMTPEQLEQAKQRMRERGLSEEQIAERLKPRPADDGQ